LGARGGGVNLLFYKYIKVGLPCLGQVAFLFILFLKLAYVSSPHFSSNFPPSKGVLGYFLLFLM
jgi:hypothetical protein